MKVFERIFEILKAIVFMPIHVSKINKRGEDLLRMEKKLDSVTQHLSSIDLENEKDFKEEIINSLSAVNDNIENLFLQFESLISIYNSLPNLRFLPSTRGWAGSPDFLGKIIEIIKKERPRFVLEASSGVSSVIIGLALKNNNLGKVISLDHESPFASITSKNIELNEVEDISVVIHCPLQDYSIFHETWKWYKIDKLEFTKTIDLLIIDGPPRTTQFLARYPAIPLLHQYFSDRVLILLDDANRNDEVIIVQKWTEFLENNEFKVSVTNFPNFEKGMVIMEVCRLKKN